MHRYRNFALALLAVILVLNGIGFVPAFCDWYAACVYPVLTEPFSRLFALVGIPVGELVMVAGIAALLVALVLAVLLVFLRGRAGFRRFARVYLEAVGACVLVVLLLFTLNWSIPFRASPLSQALDASASQANTLENLEDLRGRVILGLNEAALQVPRDGDGAIEYEDTGEENALVARALQDLDGEFPRLAGFYPAPKAALVSDVLEWMGIGGYTYPYTEEITYNRHVSRLYYPLLAAHESVHHKGYFMESDAEFLAFLALSRSDDARLRYSAYESIYGYVNRAYRSALAAEYGAEDEEEQSARYEEQEQLSDQVLSDIERDQADRDAAYRASVNQGAEDAFSGAAQNASEYGWNAQSQVLQENTYSGVVGLLLAYYYA